MLKFLIVSGCTLALVGAAAAADLQLRICPMLNPFTSRLRSARLRSEKRRSARHRSENRRSARSRHRWLPGAKPQQYQKIYAFYWAVDEFCPPPSE